MCRQQWQQPDIGQGQGMVHRIGEGDGADRIVGENRARAQHRGLEAVGVINEELFDLPLGAFVVVGIVEGLLERAFWHQPGLQAGGIEAAQGDHTSYASLSGCVEDLAGPFDIDLLGAVWLDLEVGDAGTVYDGRGCGIVEHHALGTNRQRYGIADLAERFICIADESKLVPVLGNFPLPVEVIPMARSHVARQLVKLGGDPVYREGVLTDNGNIILDVFNLSIVDPVKLESEINAIVGVVTNGLFAARPADVLLLGTSDGVQTLRA